MKMGISTGIVSPIFFLPCGIQSLCQENNCFLKYDLPDKLFRIEKGSKSYLAVNQSKMLLSLQC